MASNDLVVSEIFESIQGESTYAGCRCVFVRLAGCNLDCAYCDTGYAREQDAGTRMTVGQVAQSVAEYGCRLVEVTGGEPLCQPLTIELLAGFVESKYTVLLETNGSLDIRDVPPGVVRIVDIKTPSSGMAEQNLWTNMDALEPTDEVKFVVGDRADFDWAAGIIDRYELSQRVTDHISPVTDRISPAELARWIIGDKLDVRLNLQLHKLIWPEKDRGV
ncbi:MAG: radical SAM protein [Candidatus Hydrogenedentes bacterium]|nr:radical SAM protein [Candidatus Hydrogenedentota bacterium]